MVQKMTHYITLSSPLAPSITYIFLKNGEGTCVLCVLLVHDIQRVHHVLSTTCVLRSNVRKSFIPRKEYNYFYAIQMGECPRYQMTKGPQRDHNANMLMSTTKFGFKDTSRFGSASTHLCEQ